MWALRLVCCGVLLLPGCASATRTCLYDGSGASILPVLAVQLDSAAGSGKSCDQPVVLRGEYQRCGDASCVSMTSRGIPAPILVAERRWVQVNFYRYQYVTALKEDCGSYVAEVLLMQRQNLPAKKVYFDSTSFRGVDGPVATLQSELD